MSPDVPRVVAAGKGTLARRIVDLARAHGIIIRENADLAEMLRALAVDDQIPVAAFSIVAEILFHLLQADGRVPAPRGSAP
jgi:flagellar biosynthesis protein